MPDERGNTTADAVQETPLHAYKEGREEDVSGTMASGEQDAEAPTKTGGATSGGPPARDSESTGTDYSKVKKSAGEDQKEDGEMGLGSESGALGGGESPPNNPDPSTKGATKGTKGALQAAMSVTAERLGKQSSAVHSSSIGPKPPAPRSRRLRN